MNCKQCRKRLQDYLDEMLEAVERAQVGAHVASCEACRGELEALRKVATLVGSLDEVPEPAGFLQAVRERIDRPSVWERVRGLLAQPLRPGVSVAIPVIIIAFVGVFVLMNLPQKTIEQARKPEAAEGEAPFEIARSIEPPSESRGDEAIFYEGSRASNGEARDDAVTEESIELGAGTSLDVDADTSKEALGPTTPGKVKNSSHEDRVAKEEVTRAITSTVKVAGGGAEELDKSIEDERRAKLAEADRAEEKKRVELEEEPEAPGAGDLEVPIRSARGPKSDQQERAREEIIQLVVFDLPKDQSNVEQIVVEEGGRVTEHRSKNVLTNLVLDVPDKNFERTVERLQLYNELNIQAIEQEKAQLQEQVTEEEQAVRVAAASRRQGQLKPLPLIVRRIVERVPGE